MNISELSIGDYVRVRMCKWDYDDPNTLDAKVLSIEGNSVGVGYDNSGIVMSAFVEDLQPIPITAEVLEKNGWSKEYDDVWACGVWRIKQINKCLFVLYNEKYDYDFCVYVDTVHELQHALRLAGIDKEIVL